jgi:multidrug efflux system membrane fusion protein
VPEDAVPQLTARQHAGAPLSASVLDRAGATVLAQGALLTLDNQIDVATGTLKAKARFANASGALLANQFVNIRLLVDTVHNAIIVPASAIRHGPNGDFVWILSAAHTAQMRVVTVGPAIGERASIAHGVAPGETVITEGGDNLRPGAPVSLPGHPAAQRGGAANGGHHQGRHQSSGGASAAP